MALVIDDVCLFLESFAPLSLAESWDNVGLLLGRRERQVERVMTCLTVTPASAQEAIERGADLIVAHHPFPFKETKRILADRPGGAMLLDLLEARVAVYSPHTSFDSAAEGINQQLAAGLGLENIQPLVPIEVRDEAVEGLGAGRVGSYAKERPLLEIAQTLAGLVRVAGMHRVGPRDMPVQKVAIACGAGGSFLSQARRAHVDLLVTGEARFHSCLEAEADAIALLLPGHYATERFAVEDLARRIGEEFEETEVWASEQESDPLVWEKLD